MRLTLALVRIAVLAAACGVPVAFAQEDGERVVAQVVCDGAGHPIEIRALVPTTGPSIVTLQIPPNICSGQRDEPPAAAPPRSAASSKRMI